MWASNYFGKKLLSATSTRIKVFSCYLSSVEPVFEKEIDKVTIVGGGTMGAGIADIAAQSGFKVTIVDSDESTQKCMVQIVKTLSLSTQKRFPNEPKGAKKYIDNVLKNIQTNSHIENGCSDADLVIESIIENLNIKKDIIQKIETVLPKNSIIASNTSSLTLSELSDHLNYPENFGGLHFFNPVWKMKLVEVGRSSKTSEQTIKRLTNFAEDLGKKVVTCNDISGFIVNRLLFPYLLEALRLYDRGHASVVDIDTAMKLGAGFPLGPFEVIDRIGLDNVKMIIDGWHFKEPNNPIFFPSLTLNKLVEEKKLGKKTLHGFYEYKHKMY
ncbi:hydroxyacyl-coenzyme A dehydrogenase, mitochondrial [Hydra vulgaris]|uniref:hydroxyacyl-coenzyme A dehydrogenase, mitochondrial n=1 Tax=Hydra vulgaris TaxID=6087 RepID=UPI0001926B2E|nr:hydroxyacyl-coenzyme A dehydrogenase, mitochondrial-like [Hydra vulgaris]XP_047129061.1 hydroxyacyl-coenzyme A dehydrogenase, mitochondrial-like [Hydra vulgaris]